MAEKEDIIILRDLLLDILEHYVIMSFATREEFTKRLREIHD